MIEKTLHSITREKKGNYTFAPIFKPQPQINSIHDIVRPIVQDAQKRMYKDMNSYMENILNSPSTINRIIKYYHHVRKIDSDKEYIGFVNSDIIEIVREYDLEEYIHKEETMQMIQIWVDSGICIHKPNLIAHIPK